VIVRGAALRFGIRFSAITAVRDAVPLWVNTRRGETALRASLLVSSRLSLLVCSTSALTLLAHPRAFCLFPGLFGLAPLIPTHAAHFCCLVEPSVSPPLIPLISADCFSMMGRGDLLG
jgi:hypothetical protein